MSIFERAEYDAANYRVPKDFTNPSMDTFVVMLGSGNPFPNPMRGGPSTVVVANGYPYFVDAGEGIWRAIARSVMLHPDKLGPVMTLENLRYMFLTHLHSDHTVGLPAFFLAPYKFNAPHTKEVFGPPGTANLVENILKAYEVDIDAAWTRSGHNDSGWRANTTEITKDGIFYEDENVKIEAFKTDHAPLDHCWAFRFTSASRTIVIGGDGRYSENLCRAVKGADLFLADVCSEENLVHAPWGGEVADRVNTIRKYHMVPKDLVRLQKETGVENVVMYHEQSFLPDNVYTREGLLDEVRRAGFTGSLISSVDGDIY